MNITLDVLPGEGAVETVRRCRVRAVCEECGAPAHFKRTFLLKGYRNNPASSAYGKDDCSWCEDNYKFSCRKHLSNMRPEDGYEECSTFGATERFAHLFLSWKEVK